MADTDMDLVESDTAVEVREMRRGYGHGWSRADDVDSQEPNVADGCTSRQSQHHTCAEATRTDVSVQMRCGGAQGGSDSTRTESGEVVVRVRVHGPVVRS